MFRSSILFFALWLASPLCGVNAEHNITSLNIYEVATNRNFKVDIGRNTYYLRVGRDNPQEVGIDREKEINHYMVAEAMGIAPKLFGYHLDSGMLITEFIIGQSPTEKQIHNREILRIIVKQLQSLHHHHFMDSDIPENTVFQINDALLKKVDHLADDPNITAWIDTKKSFEKNYYRNIPLALLHADLFRGNILTDEDAKVYFIDWEYSYYGYVIDDLGKLCSANWLTNEEVKFVANDYWKNVSPLLLKKLHQNIFMQQFNFFLWCHVQVRSDDGNAESFLTLARQAKKHLNEMVKKYVLKK